MTSRPVILISPHVEKKGDEFGDTSTSLSESYQRALESAGGVPLILPLTTSREVIAECVSRADGVLLTGGDDVDPKYYGRRRLSPALRRTVGVTHGRRDECELALIDEVFRRPQPLLAICRGQQILNVALGGTLVVDIPSEIRGALNHRRMDRRSDPVHEVRLTPGSGLAKIARGDRMRVNSTHHQAVARVAPALRVTAVSADGVVEGLELSPVAAGRLPFLLSVQFHPERLAPRHPEHQRIFAAFVDACRLSRRNTL